MMLRKTLLVLVSVMLLQSCGGKKTEIVLADLVANLWWNAPPLIYNKEHYPGVNVKRIEFQTGKEAKNMVVSGQADLAVVAATPIVLSAINREDFVILGRYLESSKLVGIYSTSEDVAKLKEPIAIVPGTVSEFIFIENATRNGENPKKLNTLSTKPPAIAGLLETGQVASAIIWDPFAQEIEENPNIHLKTSTRPDNLYTMRFYLIANRNSLKNKGAEINNFIEGFEAAVQKSAGYESKIEEWLDYKQGYLGKRWPDVKFEFIRDRVTLTKELNEEASILQRAGIKGVPDFTPFFQ